MIKKHQKYKETKFYLLKDIPDSWELQKIKFVASIYNGDSLNDDYKQMFETENPEDLAYISSKDINVDTTQIQYENGLRIPKDFPKFKIAPANTSLLCIEGGSAGRKLGFTNQDVYFVNKLACFNVSNKTTSKYLFYCIRADIFQNQFHNSITGMIGGVSISNIKNFYLPFPSIEEQSSIVSYLDHQTSIIDKLIQLKNKLIELLKEKRQALIDESVTKGLNPDAKMKDSGVEWIGQIPEGWNLVPLKFLAMKIGSGVTPKGGAEVYQEQGIIFIRSQNVHFDGLRLDEVARIDNSIHEKMKGSKVQLDDVLLNITGASIGRCCVVNLDEEMNVNQHVCIIRPKQKELKSNFLNLVLQSEIGQIQVRLELTGSNREGLTFEAIKSFLIPLPNPDEQETIYNTIKVRLNDFNKLQEKIIVQIEKLMEYRQSIIYEAVTGKIDLREWKAPHTKH
jgi:type I restriction enzyme S subunit